MQFEVVAQDLAFPEGPVVLPDGSIIVVEIAAGRVTRLWGEGRTETVAVTGGGPNGAALGPDGALYVCNSGAIDPHLGCHTDEGPDAVGRIERIDLSTGKVDRLYERCEDLVLGAPNDLVFDDAGGIWFTDFGKIRPRYWGKSALFYCRPDGSSINVGFSAAVNGRGFGAISYNGVGLSPDGKTVYVADTRSTRVIGFTLAEHGRLAPGAGIRGAPDRTLATVPGDLGLDSLAVTRSGKLCIGTLWTGGISVVDPVDGRVEHLPLPDELVTNIAFGGEDMRTAYITLSGTGRVIRTRWPEPGLKLNFSG
jgi:gluconolactonase